MGQSTSSALLLHLQTPSSNPCTQKMNTQPITEISSNLDLTSINDHDPDHTSNLPDDCLALIFHSLGASDRSCCSLVSHRWLRVESQTRLRLSLKAQSDLLPSIPSLFSRFDAVSKLVLKCDRHSLSIGDEALTLISLCCTNLTRLKLRGCRQLTEAGMAALSRNCKTLTKLSCVSSSFGSKGITAIVENCASLEYLSVKRLRGLGDSAVAAPIGPGLAASALKTICLKDLYNGQCFGPLIAGSKKLESLKLFRCSGDWDEVLEVVAARVDGLLEIHLERLQVSDRGLSAVANCSRLEILHLVKAPECTNLGIVEIANSCRLLRKIHIDGWKMNRIGDEGLVAIAKHCADLRELVLISTNPSSLSLGLLASNCKKLEGLAFCGSETIGDAEILCIASKCLALKKLCIKNCPVSDRGMEALAGGFPSLVKVKVRKCRGVTCESTDMLRENRGSLVVNLDASEMEQQDVSASEGCAQENREEQCDLVVLDQNVAAVNFHSRNDWRAASSKARTGLLLTRNFVESWRKLKWLEWNVNGIHSLC